MPRASSTPTHAPVSPASSRPLAVPTSPPTDVVQWFSHSSRLVGGQPDTLYGWWPQADGRGPCIVKALQPELTAYASTLLQHERRMLQRLNELAAPVPEQVAAGQPHWVVTRFAGLTLQRLQHRSGLQSHAPEQVLGFAEALSVWVHMLRKLQPLAERGILVVDLYEGNVVVPLTQTTHGQLRLTDPVLIDHAHTLEAGMALTRPVWVNPRMPRLAPELRDVLQADQADLQDHFAKAGADLPARTELPGAQQQLNRRTWAQYQAPQRLQALLDAGRINIQAVMQFAVGKAMLSLAHQVPDETRPALEDTLLRMTAHNPAHRFASLTDAASHLATLLPHLPLVGACQLHPVAAADLVPPKHTASTDTDMTQTVPPPTPSAQTYAGKLHAQAAVTTQSPNLKRDTWLYVMLALGAALGTVLARGW